MRFDLTEEQLMLQKMVREFSEEAIKPVASQLDEEERFPREILQKAGELGLMGITIPQEYGGAGMDSISYVIAIEETSRAWAVPGAIISVNNSLVCEPLLANGTEAQKRKYLPPLSSGQKLGCFSLTEPEAGSDAGNLSSTAVLDGDRYVVNGRKLFVTGGNEADVCLLFVSTNKSKGSRGLSALVVEKGTPGFSIGKIEKKLGIKASPAAELLFEDCRVPRANLLGEEGMGFRIAMQALDSGRIGIAAQAIGIARAALEDARDHSKMRIQFGRPICENQAIQWMLADIATELDAARLLTYRAAYTKDKKVRYSTEAAMAKLYASELAMRAAIKGVQIHGGYGYTKDFRAERYLRDAKITEIYEGTSEVQRMIIAASLLR